MKRFFESAFEAWDQLHPTVAATLAGLAGAAALSAAGRADVIQALPFSTLLLRWLLPFLLFAGALHIDVPGLRQEAWFVAILSTAGVLIATVCVGWPLHWFLSWLRRDVPLAACLLFGALISPTDPIAVLAIFRRAKVPRPLAVAVGAESLFNDGFAVVMFSSLAAAAAGGAAISAPHAAELFLKQTGGGLLLGLVLGELTARAVDSLQTLQSRLAVTAALALGGYSAVNALGFSGLLAVILAGIRVGPRNLELKAVWTAVDGALNVAVFAALGLCALKVPWTLSSVALAPLAVILVLGARAASVGLSMAALTGKKFVPGTFRALTWGGLRGAIPLALALRLHGTADLGLIVVMTYAVGLFSLLVQGSTL